LYQSYTGRPPF